MVRTNRPIGIEILVVTMDRACMPSWGVLKCIQDFGEILLIPPPLRRSIMKWEDAMHIEFKKKKKKQRYQSSGMLRRAV